MRNKFVLAASMLVAMAGPIRAQEPETKEIVATLSQFGEAWKTGDPAVVAAFFDEKATLTTISGQTASGRPAIQAALVQALGGPLKGTLFSTTAEGIRVLKPGVAVQSDLFLFRSGASAQAAAGRGITNSLIVWVKRDAGWKMAAVQGMVPAKPVE